MPSEAELARLGGFASVLGPDSNIDRHGHRRTVPMSVLSLGICRTGTLSLREAYDILGYPSPYHMASVVSNIKDCDIWIELFQRKLHGRGPITRADLDQVVGHCGAVGDTPCAPLWREMIAAYPEAKVVLVERNEDSWYRSIETLLEGSLDPVAIYVLRFTDPLWCGRIFKQGLLWTEDWFGSTNLAQAKKNARAAYRAHNAGIRAAVPKERLLVYELGSGWEPLCEFLGKPVPDCPFPHRNEAESLKYAFEVTLGKAFKRSLVNVSCVVAAVALVVGVGVKLYAS